MNEGCSNCAYAEKTNGKPVWCKFHKEKVTENNTCDDFLSFLDTPVMSNLLDSVAKNKQATSKKEGIPVGNRIKDFFAWVYIIFFITLGVLAFLYC